VPECENTVACRLACSAAPVALDKGRRARRMARRAPRYPAGVSSGRPIWTTWPMPTLSPVPGAYLALLAGQAERHTAIAWVSRVPLVTAVHPSFQILFRRPRAPPILFAFRRAADKRPR
jgi:hypothetical protein